MLRRIIASSLLIGFFIQSALACGPNGGYFPENSWHFPASDKAFRGIGEQNFNDAIDRVQRIYAPIIRNHGGFLAVQKDWNDGTVNAYAQRSGNQFIVKMFGGLARHPAMTKDGFTLVMCHEIGHHIGGAPKYPEQGNTWASNEGQSDYFAGTKCMRKVFEQEDNQSIISSMQIDPTVRQSCEEKWNSANEQAICMRIAMAGFATSSMFAQLSSGQTPDFNNPHPQKVSQTIHTHPHYQCRLDTYFQSALCQEDHTVAVSQTNPNTGTCYRGSQFTDGYRPLCWYKPTNSGGDNPPPPPPPPTGNIANIPLLAGQQVFTTRNINGTIPISIDVRNIQGATGFVIEISKPNQRFSNPNGTNIDLNNHIGYEIYWATSGTYNLIPSRHLPAYGSYQIRIMGLSQGNQPAGRFSNSSILNVMP